VNEGQSRIDLRGYEILNLPFLTLVTNVKFEKYAFARVVHDGKLAATVCQMREDIDNIDHTSSYFELGVVVVVTGEPL
jgi:cupin superfamily acireductone dioxygenase involved in methionine salvage